MVLKRCWISLTSSYQSMSQTPLLDMNISDMYHLSCFAAGVILACHSLNTYWYSLEIMCWDRYSPGTGNSISILTGNRHKYKDMTNDQFCYLALMLVRVLRDSWNQPELFWSVSLSSFFVEIIKETFFRERSKDDQKPSMVSRLSWREYYTVFC